ncbi:MAG: MFS transporter [Deinococcus sp.]|uniref:MFS transporter n=1 Tax=Deinococcus sp. TaxID=47478 RepID=UPI0026DB48B5|nr:MFS transporter [Deinococcus sp.]MDO4245559.1 MFS transporter [Deinococcus sp.]
MTNMNRWVILLGYLLLTACTQMVWLSYAPVTHGAAAQMHVTVSQVGWLSAVFAGIYLVLGLPAGHWLDKSFRHALGFGAVATALGATLRVLAPDSFAVQMAGQLILAVGQPFVLNAMSALALRHFPAHERPRAIAAGSASLFVGVLLASVTAPALYEAGKLATLLTAHAIPTVVGAIWVLLSLRTPPNSATSEELGQAAQSIQPGWAWLGRDRLLQKLAGLLFVGFGLFGAISTWLEPLLGHQGISPGTAGNLMGLLVVCGILGAAVLPVVAAARGWRREFLLASMALTGLMVIALGTVQHLSALALGVGLGGFFLLACLPIVLEWAEEHVDASRQGRAVGFLLAAGNAGSLVLMLLVGAFVEQSAPVAVALLAAAVALGAVLTLGLPRQEPHVP